MLRFVPDHNRPGPAGEGAIPTNDGPFLFAALQEQLGLNLKTTKGLVIDRAEKPIACLASKDSGGRVPQCPPRQSSLVAKGRVIPTDRPFRSRVTLQLALRVREDLSQHDWGRRRAFAGAIESARLAPMSPKTRAIGEFLPSSRNFRRRTNGPGKLNETNWASDSAKYL